jgi:hypothetical protein
MYYFVTMMLLIKNHGTLCQDKGQLPTTSFAQWEKKKRKAINFIVMG